MRIQLNLDISLPGRIFDMIPVTLKILNKVHLIKRKTYLIKRKTYLIKRKSI
jgi:hypothetical protein